eukprot:TRINITY_DN2967_c0_g1_i5.p1 TRINITY_DN2967_c0_g1~~TRINITY_DN2967_c0_g1_i5.p1  ORF type:complete len:219 (+),score=69.96 TRINITY_DN2967_c0_g1_i5:76-732(+)
MKLFHFTFLVLVLVLIAVGTGKCEGEGQNSMTNDEQKVIEETPTPALPAEESEDSEDEEESEDEEGEDKEKEGEDDDDESEDEDEEESPPRQSIEIYYDFETRFWDEEKIFAFTNYKLLEAKSKNLTEEVNKKITEFCSERQVEDPRCVEAALENEVKRFEEKLDVCEAWQEWWKYYRFSLIELRLSACKRDVAIPFLQNTLQDIRLGKFHCVCRQML